MSTHPIEPPFDPYEDTPRRDQPPQDNAAEMAVLGAMLLSTECRTTAISILRPTDYWRPQHETIHHTITTMHNNDEPIDPVTVANKLGPTTLNKLGGPLYLHQLVANTQTAIPENTATHAHIIQTHARRRTAQHVATKINQAANNPHTDLDTIYTQAYEALDQAYADHGPAANRSTTWTPLPLDAVLEGGEIDPPPEILTRTDGKHLLYAGAIHTFSGEPGSGKTWVLLEATKQELNNGNTVTMIDFEDRASRVVGRLMALGVHPNTIRAQFRYIRPNTPIDPATKHDLQQAIKGTTLVILDGVTEAMTMHGLDLNANADIATFYGLLPRWICDQGPAVALIDHVTKDEDKQGRWAIGGQHKLAGIDGVAYIVKTVEKFGRGKIGHSRIIVAKDRPGYIEEIAAGRSVAELWLDARNNYALKCELKPSIGIPKQADGEFRYTIIMEQVSRFIETNDGCTSTEIYVGIETHKTNTTKALAALLTEEYITRESGPRNAKYHRSIRPYRHDEDEPTHDPIQ